MALKKFDFQTFNGGYDSFSGSRSNVKDNEIPALPGITQNVILDDNGSPQKRNGFSIWSAPLATNQAVTGIGVFQNGPINTVIASSGTSWWNAASGTGTALTGKVFTAKKQTTFCAATGALFGANGVENLCYTTDAATITEITANTMVGTYPTFFNQRIYMLSTQYPDRVYYSNAYGFTAISAISGATSINSAITGYDYANMFVTNLSATPKQNAGFLVFEPGSGVQLVALYKDGDVLYVYSKSHGAWAITPSTAVNSDGTITHNVPHTLVGIGCPAPRSITKVAQNDMYFYGGDNVYSRGEVQYYQSPRVTTQSGRVQSEMRNVLQSAKPNVALQFYLNKVYVAYQTGSNNNDTLIVKDTVLNAWSTPFVGIPVSCFCDYTDAAGSRHLLAGSSDPTRPYLFELNVGTTDGGIAINAAFETKSSDCKAPGLIKYAAFIDVFYQLLSGSLDCQVIGDEATVLATYSQQQQLIASGSNGVGSRLVGTFLVGAEFTPGSTIAAASYEGQFRIPVKYKPFRRISIRFTNARLNEQFKINNAVVWFQEGKINTPLK